MHDLSNGLKHAVDSVPVSPPPDFDRLVALARRRRVRVQAFAATASVGVVLLTAAVVFSIVAGPDRERTPLHEGADTTFQVPTAQWDGGDSAGALVTGALRFTADNCPYVGDGPEAIVLAFPDGARGVATAAGPRSVVDANGFIYGTEGESVSFGGGTLASGVANACTGPAGDAEIFFVNDDPSTKRIDR
jgi:hypothetical protein